jgi:DNA-directed RNA polymerase subunit L
MNIDVKKIEKNYVEILLVGEDISLAEALREILVEDKEVEFVATKLEHPQASHPMLILRTKTKDAIDMLIEASAKLKENCEEFKTALKQTKKTK